MIYKDEHKINRINIDGKEIYRVYFNGEVIFKKYHPVTAIVATTSNQYIATDMKDFWAEDIDFEITFAVNWNSSCPFGCRPDKSYQEYCIMVGNDKTISVRQGGATVNGTTPTYATINLSAKTTAPFSYNLLGNDAGDANALNGYEITQPHTIKKTKDNIYHNGSLMAKKTTYNDFFLTYLPPYFFKLNQVDFEIAGENPNSPNANGIRYLYHAVFYKKGKLYREYIPVLDENGIPALYEKVTHSFHYSSTDTPLEYFEGQYGQIACIYNCSLINYVDTNIFPKDIGKWELRLQSANNTTITTNIGMGSAASANSGLFFNRYSKTIDGVSKHFYQLQIGSQTIQTNIPFISDSEIIIKFDLINNRVSIAQNNQQTLQSIKEETYDIFTSNLDGLPSLFLGKINGYGNACIFRIYQSKIYNKDGILIQNLKPRVNLNTKKACMYDEITKEPYAIGTLVYI